VSSVTASLPAFSRQGSRMDVTVSALGTATSLLGGTLLVGGQHCLCGRRALHQTAHLALERAPVQGAIVLRGGHPAIARRR